MLRLAKNAGPAARYQGPLLAARKLSTLKRIPLQVYRILLYLLVTYIQVDIQGAKLQISEQINKQF